MTKENFLDKWIEALPLNSKEDARKEMAYDIDLMMDKENQKKAIIELMKDAENDLDNSYFQLKMVYDWLMDETREPAQTKFTEGWQRNLAKEIEYRLSEHF